MEESLANQWDTWTCARTVRCRREYLGLSQVALVELVQARHQVSTDQATISRLERGLIESPSIPLLAALATALGLDVALLLNSIWLSAAGHSRFVDGCDVNLAQAVSVLRGRLQVTSCAGLLTALQQRVNVVYPTAHDFHGHFLYPVDPGALRVEIAHMSAFGFQTYTNLYSYRVGNDVQYIVRLWQAHPARLAVVRSPQHTEQCQPGHVPPLDSRPPYVVEIPFAQGFLSFRIDEPWMAGTDGVFARLQDALSALSEPSESRRLEVVERRLSTIEQRLVAAGLAPEEPPWPTSGNPPAPAAPPASA